MPLIVSPPQGSDGGSAVVASGDGARRLLHRRSARRAGYIGWMAAVRLRGRGYLAGRVGLSQCELCCFRYTVVVRRTPIAALLTASSITASTTGASTVWNLICGYKRLPDNIADCGGRYAAVLGLGGGGLGWAWRRLGRGISLETGRSMLISGFQVEATGITDGFAGGGASPERCPIGATVATFIRLNIRPPRCKKGRRGYTYLHL